MWREEQHLLHPPPLQRRAIVTYCDLLWHLLSGDEPRARAIARRGVILLVEPLTPLDRVERSLRQLPRAVRCEGARALQGGVTAPEWALQGLCTAQILARSPQLRLRPPRATVW